MRETFNISDSILKQLAETPEERLYWTAGVRMIAPRDYYSDVFLVYDSERSAWIHREQRLRNTLLFTPNGYPRSYARSEVNELAKEWDFLIVNIRDETGAIVESWEVE